MKLPRFAIIGLNGQPVERYETRAAATVALDRLHKETDYIAQDKADEEFCKRYGVPFQPRRYFVMENV